MKKNIPLQNKEYEESMQVIRRNVLKAAKVLISLLDSKSDEVKLLAAIYILDRVYGKPVQPIAENRGPKSST